MNYQNHRNLNLNDLVQILKAENGKKRDMIIPATELSMQGTKLRLHTRSGSDLNNTLSELGMLNGVSIMHEDITEFTTLDVCHEHLSEKLKINKPYYDKMLSEYPDLLDHNVSKWLEHENHAGDNYLLRGIQTEKEFYARALLSDRYKCIDHFDILLATLDASKESGMNVVMDRADITDKRMYVRFICPEIELDASNLLKNYRVPGFNGKDNGSKGIISGFVLTNSEVGFGTFSISPRAVIKVCDNGLIRPEDNFRKVHLGGKLEEQKLIHWSEDTQQQNLKLIRSQIIDCVKKFTSKEYLGEFLDKLMEKGSHKVEHPIGCMLNACKFYGINDKATDDILKYFVEGGETTAFGVSQAITYYAHETSDANVQYDLERAGVEVLDRVPFFDTPIK